MNKKLLLWMTALILMAIPVLAGNDTSQTYHLYYNNGTFEDVSPGTMCGNPTIEFVLEANGWFNNTINGCSDFMINLTTENNTQICVAYDVIVDSIGGGLRASSALAGNIEETGIEHRVNAGGDIRVWHANNGDDYLDTDQIVAGSIYNTSCLGHPTAGTKIWTNGVYKGFVDKGAANIGNIVTFLWRFDGQYSAVRNIRIWHDEDGNCTTEPKVLAGSPPASANFTITAQDEWNSTSIIAFNATVNGTTYQSNASGVIETTIPANSTNLFNITVASQNYFNRTYTGYNSSLSGDLTAELHQAELCFNATQKVDEAWVTPDSITIDGTTHTSCFNLSADTYNVQATKAGWYNHNQTFTVTALQNATLTIQNLSYANLTIYAIDGTTNESLSGYSLRIGSTTSPTFLETATGVTNHSVYLINGTYNTTITMPGYATTTGFANITVGGHTNHTFTLYKANSVTITIRDEITNNLITDNVTIRWTNNATTWENITDTGTLFISNLTVSNYTLLFYSSNYSTRTYTISVGNLSTQFLTAYMISSAYSTIFTIKDIDTGDILPDVLFTMYKQINSTWSPVESKYSDITGKVQVYYDPIGNYRFYLAKTGYEDLIFYLNPILFSTYDVKMVKTSPLNYTVDYDDIAILYGPKAFYNNNNTILNFLISSPRGLLTDYSITVTYPGGNDTASGVNAIGEQLSVWVNITNATRWDRVRLDYNYTTSLSGTRTFTQYLPIITNATASENTWMANKDRTFGMGLFERVLIATIIVILVVGIASLVGQSLPGVALGLFVFGFLTYIGFIPLWAILPSMLIGVLFLVWKSGGY